MLARVLKLGDGQLTARVIRELVETREAESQWLEFKRQLPDRKGKEDEYLDLAQCVSSFANAMGGVVIFGIEEEDDKACRLTPVPLGRETSSLAKSLDSCVVPRLDGLRWHSVPEEGTDEGYLVLEIQPSVLRPHFVMGKNRHFSAWKRVEKQPQALSEADIERAYKDRFEKVNDVDSAMEQLERRARSAAGVGCLWFGLIPIGTHGRIYHSPMQAAEALRLVSTNNAAWGLDPTVFEADVRVRFRRLEAAASWGDGKKLPACIAHLTDTGHYLRINQAWPVSSASAASQQVFEAQGARSYVTTFFLLDRILTALTRYREQARVFSIAGPVALRAGLFMEPYQIGFLSGGMLHEPLGIVGESVKTELQFDIGDLFQPRSLVEIARQILIDMHTAFGVTTGIPISEDGVVLLSKLDSTARAWATEWTRRNGVPTLA